MTEAETILKLIETVSPDDTTKLDELNMRVAFFLENKPYPEWKGIEKCFDLDRRMVPNWCGSRDALKAIRPEGWHYECNKICDGTFWAALHQEVDAGPCGDAEGMSCEAWYRKTEELAELHAIIQSLEWERQNAK